MALLIALLGIMIWFVHFGGVYATQGFICGLVSDALGEGFAISAVQFVIAFLSAVRSFAAPTTLVNVNDVLGHAEVLSRLDNALAAS